MAALRDSERDILQMAYWDELSVAEIAGVLQCSEAAAKVRLHRARAAFRKQMPVTPGAGKQNTRKQNPGKENAAKQESATEKMGA